MLEALIAIWVVGWISMFGAGSNAETTKSYPNRKPTAYELRTIQQTAKFYPDKDMSEFLGKER